MNHITPTLDRATPAPAARTLICQISLPNHAGCVTLWSDGGIWITYGHPSAAVDTTIRMDPDASRALHDRMTELLILHAQREAA